VPPFHGASEEQIKSQADAAFIPVDVLQDKQYLLSLRHGDLLEPAALMTLLRGGFQGSQFSSESGTRSSAAKS
jgi:hypothetical protein